jgi:hypothetical protein
LGPQNDAERVTRSALFLLVLAVFLLIPLRIIAYGYVPPDDALRHAAFATVDRTWGDILLFDPAFPAGMDPHAGWHATLRAIHEATGWEQGRLVSCAVVLAFWVFAFSGAVASGNPPAWFLACALMSALEPILLGKLYLGRPLFFSMSAVTVLLLLWTRREPLRVYTEFGVSFLMLAIAIFMHPTSWYLWAMLVPPLVVCRKWRSLASFAAAWTLAVAAAATLNGWYNTVQLPVDILRRALLQEARWARTWSRNSSLPAARCSACSWWPPRCWHAERVVPTCGSSFSRSTWRSW